MRFKSKKSSIPEVNLVPMLDVLMTVLTFFIIVSMTLTMEQGVNVQFPRPQPNATPAADLPDVLVVQLTASGMKLNDRPTPQDQLAQEVVNYLAAKPEGAVVLQAADQQLKYEQVVQVLGTLKDIGGDRVSLAVEQP